MRTTIVRSNLTRRAAWLAMLVTAVVLLAACGDDGGNNSSSATSAPRSTTTTEQAAPETGPVATASHPTLGTILVDDAGRTLYVFDADQGGTIACGTGCTGAWPPVLLGNGASLPTSGPLSADLATVSRPDGGEQVTYKTRPLYRFASDTQPGDAKGDGLGNAWHVVKV
jgi:predicted lipoprotein with Yx(FWY)xxD motif